MKTKFLFIYFIIILLSVSTVFALEQYLVDEPINVVISLFNDTGTELVPIENQVCNGSVYFYKNGYGELLELKNTVPAQFLIVEAMSLIAKSTTHSTTQMYADLKYPYFKLHGTDGLKGKGYFRLYSGIGSNAASMGIWVSNPLNVAIESLLVEHDKVSFKNLPLKDIKNHADATLSGTPKVIELLIGATSYYFKVYPTKT